MIGTKTLSTIRQELQSALTATGVDPIRWLEERMAAPERQVPTVSGESAVLHSLRRIIEAKGAKNRRKQRVGTKK